MFKYIIKSWTNSENGKVVFDRPLQKISTEWFPENELRSDLVVPYIDFEETGTDACEINRKFAMLEENYEVILVTYDAHYK